MASGALRQLARALWSLASAVGRGEAARAERAGLLDAYATVMATGRAGLNNCEIARATGIPRSTVSQWLNGRQPRFGTDRTRGGACGRCGTLQHPMPSLLVHSYAYLLGLYLGDGCLLKHRRGDYRLHITLDAAHPVIAAECQAAMALVMPHATEPAWAKCCTPGTPGKANPMTSNSSHASPICW